MKMQKGVEREIRAAIGALQDAVDYITQNKVAGIAMTCDNPRGNTYTIRNPACLETIAGNPPEHIDVYNQHVGSKLCGLYNGLRTLNRLIEVCQ